MDRLWYLDSWDRLGGRGFSTLRAGRDDSANREDGESDGRPSVSVYIGPPDFRPEMLASSATALGAGRSGWYQSSVPVEGPEIGFPSPDAVAEFVRRAFIYGGSGSNGGGEDVPEGPTEPSDDPEGDASGGLKQFCKSLREKSESIELAYKRDGRTSAIERSPIELALVVDDDVLSGGIAILVTLLETAVRSDSGPQSLRRRRAAGALVFAFDELDLWSEVASSRWAYVRTLLEKLWNEQKIPGRFLLPEMLDGPSEIVARCLLTLIASGFADNHSQELERMRYLWMRGRLPAIGSAFVGNSAAAEGRYDALFQWVLPRVRQRHQQYDLPVGVKPNVGALLNAFVADPARFHDAPRMLYTITAFAAAFLSSRSSLPLHGGWRGKAAQLWLSQSLPAWAYVNRLEDAIRGNTSDGTRAEA